MHRAVFLDRDGVLNATFVDGVGVPRPPADVSELRLEEGALEACTRLKAAGFVLVAVTNQPDVARGTTTREQVDAINARLAEWLPLDEIAVCFHDDADGCACRKPAPGLLRDAAARLGLDLPASYMVGDRWSDVAAGKRAGCRTVLIQRGYSGSGDISPDHTAESLFAASALILQHVSFSVREAV